MITLTTGHIVLALLLVASATVQGCQDGSKIPVVGVCQSYEECSSGAWETKQCPPANSFDPTTSTCKYSWDVNCIDAPGSCTKAGLRLPVPENCSDFFQCGANGKFQRLSCGLLMRFDQSTSTCQFFTTVSCSDTPQCSGTVKVPVDDKCQYFRHCENGKWVVRSCGKGMALDVTTDTCTKRTGSEDCTSFAQCRDKLKRPVPGDCTAYSECHDGKWYIHSCGPLSNFDFTKGSCVFVGQAGCTPAKCSPNVKLPVYQDCSQFWECQDNAWKVSTCPDPGQIFDQTTLECTDAADGTCALGPTTTTLPTTTSSNDASSSSSTSSTQSSTTSAPTSGSTTSGSTKPSSTTSGSTKPSSTTSGSTKPSSTTSGSTKPSSTTSGSTKPSSTTSGPTTPFPVPCKDGDTKGVTSNCKEYLQCVKGTWETEHCPTHWYGDDYYDCPTNSCKYTGAKCCK